MRLCITLSLLDELTVVLTLLMITLRMIRNRCDLKSSIIEFNEVEYSGVIYVADNATVDFSSCTFSHNAAWVNGGVLEAIDKSATVNFDACVFEYNSAGNNGGVAVAGSSSVLRFDSSLFRGNTAMSGACIASEVSGEIVVSKSTFTSNYAYLNGGVLFTGLYTNSTFSNCTFTDSVAAYSGGVVYAYGVSQLHISNCVGLRNQAEYSGKKALLCMLVLHYAMSRLFILILWWCVLSVACHTQVVCLACFQEQRPIFEIHSL